MVSGCIAIAAPSSPCSRCRVARVEPQVKQGTPRLTLAAHVPKSAHPCSTSHPPMGMAKSGSMARAPQGTWPGARFWIVIFMAWLRGCLGERRLGHDARHHQDHDDDEAQPDGAVHRHKDRKS